ncbi:MAG: hypothetical protein JXR95_00100 [Deltaproteobacteria bacterium]|nr:hypothetical protein [Deltaproteobacteria bacterium]
MNTLSSLKKQLLSSIDGVDFQILSPVRGQKKTPFYKPAGKEVLLLLSGRIIINTEKSAFAEMPKDRALVMDKPYRLSCPDGCSSGKILRILTNSSNSSVDAENSYHKIDEIFGTELQ